MHEWMGDNRKTPHIVVDATVDGVGVPEVEVGRIEPGRGADLGVPVREREVPAGGLDQRLDTTTHVALGQQCE